MSDGRQFNGRYQRGLSVEERFWSKVNKRCPSGCWQWTAALVPGTGYGSFQVAKGHRVNAHRWAYETLAGPIPPGMQLDHLCRNRACVNPDHLEPVTPMVNARRGAKVSILLQDACDFGHDLYRWGAVRAGRRVCRVCRSCYSREYSWRGGRGGFSRAEAVKKWESVVLSTLDTEVHPRQKHPQVDQRALVAQARADARIPFDSPEAVPA